MKNRSDNRMTAAAAGAPLAAGLLVAAASGAGAASPAPPATDRPASAAGTAVATACEAYTVTPSADAPLRQGPGSGYGWQSTLRAGHPYPAYCWLHGEAVVHDGHGSTIWVYVHGGTDVGYGHVGAAYLRGDERGGLPASAQC